MTTHPDSASTSPYTALLQAFEEHYGPMTSHGKQAVLARAAELSEQPQFTASMYGSPEAARAAELTATITPLQRQWCEERGLDPDAERASPAKDVGEQDGEPMNEYDLAILIADKLAEYEGEDQESLHTLRWSGGPTPEPLGDAWAMDYEPRGTFVAKAILKYASQMRPQSAVQGCDARDAARYRTYRTESMRWGGVEQTDTAIASFDSTFDAQFAIQERQREPQPPQGESNE